MVTKEQMSQVNLNNKDTSYSVHPAHQLHCPSLGGHTIDFSIIAFKTPACFQLPTPRCHCSAAAQLTDKWEELAWDTHNLHQTRKDK